MKRWTRRPYEKHALVAVRRERVIVLFWTRRGRKSTNLGAIAFDEMSKESGRTVISASASLLLGSELVNMTISATEQAILVTNEAAAVRAVFQASADARNLDFKCADADSGKIYEGMTPEDFADLYKSKRLEMRLYFDKTTYSRQLVIAPNPATARGWRGTVLRDEAGFTSAALEKDLREAVDPIMRDVPDLKMIYASNLPRDDRHPFFEMTMPPAGLELATNPAGNFYRGQDGILVHRVTLSDAYAAGHVLYDNKGKPLTFDQFASLPSIKDQLDTNYELVHKMGGTAALDLLAILTAQARGARTCAFVYVKSEADFLPALELLRDLIGPGEIGVGLDPATTTKKLSNPTACTITERVGTGRAQRLVLCWKEKEPAVVIERLRMIFRTIGSRPFGGNARRFCIAATNERYFAKLLADALAGIVPTELIIESETSPADGVIFKTYLGDLYSAAVNDNRYDMPADDYFKADQRATVKSGGRYECDIDATTGAHGDTFVSGALAELALRSGGPAEMFPSAITTYGQPPASGPWKNPHLNANQETTLNV